MEIINEKTSSGKNQNYSDRSSHSKNINKRANKLNLSNLSHSNSNNSLNSPVKNSAQKQKSNLYTKNIVKKENELGEIKE